MESETENLSSLSFASSSLTSNGSSGQSIPYPGYVNDPVAGAGAGAASPELLSLSKLSDSLEKLLLDSEYDFSDAVIAVEGDNVGVNRCILASRSEFFHELFKKKNIGTDSGSEKDGKPTYEMKELVPRGRVGYEAFMVYLNYVYTGKLKPPPVEVSTCIDETCVHDACGPAISSAVELMYAATTFQMKELVLLYQRRLLNFVDKAFVENVIPIAVVAFHCQLKQLQSHCVQRIARSDLDDIFLEKELPLEVVTEIKSFRRQSTDAAVVENSPGYDKRVRRIHLALESADVELLNLLLAESDITLDDAFALHYTAAYCNSKVLNELLGMNKADLNLRNARGYTALHVAARRKDPSVIVGLLSEGASISDSTFDGQTAITICRRLTRPKDYSESTIQGQKTNKDKLCIDVLEREMKRNPMAGNMSVSSMMAADDLVMRLLFLENRVALARVLFPVEAKLAMEIANAHSTSEFRGISASKGLCGNLREVDLNEIPQEQVKRLQLRMIALQKTVDTGRRFFPNCSEVLEMFLEDEMQETLQLEKGPPEEQSGKKMRYMELKEEVMKAFDKDKAEKKWVSFSSSSSCSPSPRKRGRGI